MSDNETQETEEKLLPITMPSSGKAAVKEVATTKDEVAILKTPTSSASFTDTERVPSSWYIVQTDEDGVIIATHRETGRKFTGSVAEFNKSLRG